MDFFSIFIFIDFLVVKNYEMFGNSDSGSITYFESPGQEQGAEKLTQSSSSLRPGASGWTPAPSAIAEKVACSPSLRTVQEAW